jgi:hypothetical protein
MTLHSRTLTPAAAAARIAPLLITLAALAIAAGGLWLWRHRQQIGAALVATAAATYAAGAWLRLQIEAMAFDSARRLPAQPVTALAPITAGIAAAWGLADRIACELRPVESDPISTILTVISQGGRGIWVGEWPAPVAAGVNRENIARCADA